MPEVSTAPSGAATPSSAGTPTATAAAGAGGSGGVSPMAGAYAGRGVAPVAPVGSNGVAATGTLAVPDWGLFAEEVAVKGRAVFSPVTIPQGAVVLMFQGPLFDRDTCPEFSEALQVGVNSWCWSSGGLDDLVNHSCVPNTGLWQPGDGATYLVALKDIPPRTELSFDYSTSMVDEPWSMECACGEGACRGHIANFLDMPAEAQAWYAARGVLPEHVWVTAAARGVELKRGTPPGYTGTLPPA
jgi:hypothetical protein